MPEPIRIVMNPPDLLQRMSKYPTKLGNEMHRAMQMSMYAVASSVPPYPARSSSYRRTGQLGRSLTVGAMGAGNVMSITKLGGGSVEGRFGTNLEYAMWVIGEKTQARQHRGIWWTMADVRERAKPKVEKAFFRASERMVAWLAAK